jgi:hypothetical protein
VSNYAFKDPVVSFIAPNFDLTLVIISQIYTTKMMHDCQAVRELVAVWCAECGAYAVLD